jgi:hypothetical protein
LSGILYFNIFIFFPTKNKMIYSVASVSCIESLRTCFRQNAMGRGMGQCCECEVGWGGVFCDLPLCRKSCVHGKCDSRDKCTCSDYYTGDSCTERIFKIIK